MEESIYNLLPKQDSAASAKGRNKPRYVSKFATTARKEAKASKKQGTLMGPPGAAKPNPQTFLRKNAGEKRANSLAATKRNTSAKKKVATQNGKKKPPVPRANERPVMGVTSKKNFLKDNAIKAVTSQGPLNKTKRKDDTDFTKKKSYGKTPNYIKTRRAKEAAEQEEYEHYLRTVQQQDAPYQVPEEERQELLRGLRTNWTQLYREYQGLSVVADTIPKKQRKTQMEARLAQLEADIKRVERHKIILVQ